MFGIILSVFKQKLNVIIFSPIPVKNNTTDNFSFVHCPSQISQPFYVLLSYHEKTVSGLESILSHF